MEFVRAGRVLLLPVHPVEKPHAWCVLTDPDPHKVVVVMWVSVKPHTDPTVALHVGDHPWIRHPTHVNFGAATFLPVVKVREAIQAGRCELLADCSSELLQRMRAGLHTSSRTPNGISEYCRARF